MAGVLGFFPTSIRVACSVQITCQLDYVPLISLSLFDSIFFFYYFYFCFFFSFIFLFFSIFFFTNWQSLG